MLQFRLVDYILHTWNTHCGIARCFACLRTHHLGVCVGCSWYPLPTNLPYQCHVLYLTQTYPITRFGFRATDHRWSDIPCLLQIITITHFVTSQRDNLMRYFECLLNGVRFYYIDIPTGTRIEFFSPLFALDEISNISRGNHFMTHSYTTKAQQFILQKQISEPQNLLLPLNSRKPLQALGGTI